MKKLWLLSICALVLVGCGTNETTKTSKNEEEVKEERILQVAAAASMENVFEERLIPEFEAKTGIKIEGVYDASGKLQTQIEAGLGAGIFISAAPKQVNALIELGFIKEDNSKELLENKVVLIQGVNSNQEAKSFVDLSKANTVALGDPASVPIGQYSEEILDNLNIRESVEGKVSYATNVTEVLRWVEEGSADIGIVYATDASSSDKVEIIAEAGSAELNSKVIYPVAMLGDDPTKEAKEFYEFLFTKDAQDALKEFGFTPFEVE